MRKFILSLCLSLMLVSVSSRSADAFILPFIHVEAPGYVTDIGNFVSKIGKWAKKQMDSFSQLALIKTIGEGAKEAIAWGKEFKGQVMSYVDTFNEAKAYYDETMRVVGDNIIQIKRISDDIRAIKARQEEITYEIKNIRSTITSALDADVSVLRGKIDAIEQNKILLKKAMDEKADNVDELRAKLEEMDRQKAYAEHNIESLTDTSNSSILNATRNLEEQYRGLKRDLQRLMDDLTLIASDSPLLMTPAEAMTNTRDRFFLEEGEEETPERMEEMRINRIGERNKSIREAYEVSTKQLLTLSGEDADAEDEGYASGTLDTSAGAFSMDTRIKVKAMRPLLKYVELLIADIKRETSVQLTTITQYRIQEEAKDIGKFNFDDYYFDASKAGGN